VKKGGVSVLYNAFVENIVVCEWMKNAKIIQMGVVLQNT